MRGTRRFRYADLSTYKQDVQELPSASGGGFARDRDHVIGLGIQRAGLGAGLGFHGFFEHELRGAFFLIVPEFGEGASTAVATQGRRHQQVL
jgi:hypothetical protein